MGFNSEFKGLIWKMARHKLMEFAGSNFRVKETHHFT